MLNVSNPLFSRGWRKFHATVRQLIWEMRDKTMKISCVVADENNPNDFPGIEVVRDADLPLVSLRRRTRTTYQLNIIR